MIWETVPPWTQTDVSPKITLRENEIPPFGHSNLLLAALLDFITD